MSDTEPEPRRREKPPPWINPAWPGWIRLAANFWMFGSAILTAAFAMWPSALREMFPHALLLACTGSTLVAMAAFHLETFWDKQR